MIQKLTTYCYKIQAAESEIMENINAGILEKIRATDKHPFFQSFVTVQEGQGTPSIIGESSKVINWGRDAISSVKNVVNKYIQAFNGHIPGTNETAGRKSLGSIAGHYEKIINGRLSHISIFYHPPGVKEEAKNFDSCSHEGEWQLKEYPEKYEAEKLKKLTGVALLKKEETPPALSGALKLGAVQAYNVEANLNEPEIIPPGKGIGERQMDLTTIGFEELKSEVIRRQAWPTQIWSKDEILKDRGLSAVVEELTAGKAKITELESSLSKITTEKEGLLLEQSKTTAAPRLKDAIKDLTPKVQSFINTQFNKRPPSDLTEEGIKTFIESSTKEYDEYLQVFKEPAPGSGEKLPPGPGESSSTPEIENTLLNEILGEL